jgi:hypothetical protein
VLSPGDDDEVEGQRVAQNTQGGAPLHGGHHGTQGGASTSPAGKETTAMWGILAGRGISRRSSSIPPSRPSHRFYSASHHRRCCASNRSSEEGRRRGRTTNPSTVGAALPGCRGGGRGFKHRVLAKQREAMGSRGEGGGGARRRLEWGKAPAPLRMRCPVALLQIAAVVAAPAGAATVHLPSAKCKCKPSSSSCWRRS